MTFEQLLNLVIIEVQEYNNDNNNIEVAESCNYRSSGIQ